MLAIVAHDRKKTEMVLFVASCVDFLSKYRIVATDGTGRRLRDELGLDVETAGTGPRGGDVTIAAAVVAGKVDAVFFFVDPMTAHPHSPDVSTLIRQCCLHDVPIALNSTTAAAVVALLNAPAEAAAVHRFA